MGKSRDLSKVSSLQMPWMSAQNPELDEATAHLIKELGERHAKTAEFVLSAKERSNLMREFKNSEQGRSPLNKFLASIARKMNITNPEAVFVAPMKDWDRAVEKLHAPGRTLHDLGRARIKVSDAKQVKAFYKLLPSKDSEGHISGTPAKAFMLPGSLDDYLQSPRKSGYAGSINFDVEVYISKGRWGTLEVQIMPDDYEVVDKRSHRLFDMIRILHEIPDNFRTEEHKYLAEGLVIANQALFDEQAIRTRFDVLRAKPIYQLTEAKLKHATDVLERVRNAVDNIPGRKLDWIVETADALSYAKTSVLNMYLASNLPSEPVSQAKTHEHS